MTGHSPSHPDAHVRAIDGRGLRIPASPQLAEALVLLVALSAIFLLVYFGADWIAARRGGAYSLFVETELAIPLVPVFVVPYLSMFAMYLLPVFQMDVAEIRNLATRIVLCDLVCGAIFIVVPTRLGFADAVPAGAFAPAYATILAIDATHNLVPSLHVASSSLVALAMMDAAIRPLRILYAIWLFLIVISVVLTHRHHLIDVVAGLAVVALCLRLVPPCRPLKEG